jgi:hypothetical protein
VAGLGLAHAGQSSIRTLRDTGHHAVRFRRSWDQALPARQTTRPQPDRRDLVGTGDAKTIVGVLRLVLDLSRLRRTSPFAIVRRGRHRR